MINFKKASMLMIFLFLLAGCASSDKYTALSKHTPKPENCNIDVFMTNDIVQKEYTNIGVFAVEDTGFSVTCDLENAINKNKQAACQAGADAIKFTLIQAPDYKSTCYRTVSSFLKYK